MWGGGGRIQQGACNYFNYFVIIGIERSTTTLKLIITETILLYSAKYCNRIGSDEITELQAFTDSDCTFGARVRKTAGARCCCIPELPALKGLKHTDGFWHPTSLQANLLCVLLEDLGDKVLSVLRHRGEGLADVK